MRKEMGHAGHFICGHMCQFRRNTYVNGFIVSTVGEYHPSTVFEDGKLRARRDADPPETIGAGPHLYETMVFKAVAAKKGTPGAECCPFRAETGDNIDGERHMTSDEAEAWHERTVLKYEKKKP